MGLGDEIMATAWAKQVAEDIGVKTCYTEWSKIFKGNPYITHPGKGFQVMNCTGSRPYIIGQTDKRVIFNPNFHAVPGELYLTNNEKKEAQDLLKKYKDFILVQPEVKLLFSKGNKGWPRKYWRELVDKLDQPVLQMVSNNSEVNEGLGNTKVIVAETFRVACAVVAEAKLLIGTDGGLHHAAAALRKPAVVIWTGFSHPKTLGYPFHCNVRYDDSPPCGMKIQCDHCKKMAEKLTPDMVFDATREYLDELSANIHKG